MCQCSVKCKRGGLAWRAIAHLHMQRTYSEGRTDLLQRRRSLFFQRHTRSPWKEPHPESPMVWPQFAGDSLSGETIWSASFPTVTRWTPQPLVGPKLPTCHRPRPTQVHMECANCINALIGNEFRFRFKPELGSRCIWRIHGNGLFLFHIVGTWLVDFNCIFRGSLGDWNTPLMGWHGFTCRICQNPEVTTVWES